MNRAEEIALIESIIRDFEHLYWFECSECGAPVIGGGEHPSCRRCGLVF